MHYDRQYTAESQGERDAAAIRDFQEYINSQERWSKIIAAINHPDTTYRKWVLSCSFLLGVEGVPVDALWRRERGEVPDEDVQVELVIQS